jgi:hypothetical protein
LEFRNMQEKLENMIWSCNQACKTLMYIRPNAHMYLLWCYGLSNFQAEGMKLEIFLPKIQQPQRKLLNFENWCDGEVSKSALI